MNQRAAILVACIAFIALLGGRPAVAEIRIGVLAHRPAVEVAKRWEPLARYLEHALGQPVRLEALPYPALEEALLRQRVDFVLTNPAHYIALSHRQPLSGALVTVLPRELPPGASGFGGVIITRAGRTAPTSLTDLRQARIAAVGPYSLGGYQAQAMLFAEAGLRLPDANRIQFFGMPHDRVVEAVLRGEADAGFVRSGVIEQMVSEGRLAANAIEVMLPQSLPGFPYRVSTRLYPEWPLLSAPHVDPVLARLVAANLLLMEPDSPYAHALGVHGFAVAADYHAVEALLRTLRLPPFDHPQEITWTDLWREHHLWIGAVASLLLLLTGSVWVLGRAFRRVRDSESALRESEELYRLAQVATGVGVWDWDVAADEIVWDARCWSMLGFDARDEVLHYAEWRSRVHADDLVAIEGEVQAQLREGGGFIIEFRYRTASGGWLWVQGRGKVVARDANGAPVRMMGTHTDIDARKRLELELAASRRRLDRLMASNPSVVYALDPESLAPRFVSQSAERLFGERAETIVATPGWWSARLHDEDRERVLEQFGTWRGEGCKGELRHRYRIRRRDGSVLWVEDQITALRNDAGVVTEMVGSHTDISAVMEMTDSLAYIAHYDGLTGLPNRMLLGDRLRQSVLQGRRRGLYLAVAFIDLDGFKAVNDTHGHAAGDALLVALSQRMKACLRECDTIARLGGDEFVAVLADLTDSGAALPVVERLLAAAASPVDHDGQVLQVSASIGVAFQGPADERDADQLLRLADQVMYAAKQAGKNRYSVFGEAGVTST